MNATPDPYFAPWGTVTPEFWQQSPPPTSPHLVSALGQLLADAGLTTKPVPTEPDPATDPASPDSADGSQIPAAFRDQITAIDTAVADGRLDEAAEVAAQADAQITAAHGPQHEYTVNVRELRGYIAHLRGQHADACQWYLHTAGIRLETLTPASPRTRDSARRAAAMWQQIGEPEVLRRMGVDLTTLLVTVEGPRSRAMKALRARLAAAEDDPTVHVARAPQPRSTSEGDARPVADPRGHGTTT